MAFLSKMNKRRSFYSLKPLKHVSLVTSPFKQIALGLLLMVKLTPVDFNKNAKLKGFWSLK